MWIYSINILNLNYLLVKLNEVGYHFDIIRLHSKINKSIHNRRAAATPRRAIAEAWYLFPNHFFHSIPFHSIYFCPINFVPVQLKYTNNWWNNMICGYDVTTIGLNKFLWLWKSFCSFVLDEIVAVAVAVPLYLSWTL